MKYSHNQHQHGQGGGKDACQGDSGGPLVTTLGGNGVTPGQNYVLIGELADTCQLNSAH